MTEDEEKKWLNKVALGSCFDLIKALPDESVDVLISSPPYFALRDYKVEGQFGQEKSFDEYVDKLCQLMLEAKRVLKKSGSIWINIGDSYSSTGENASGEDEGGETGISWVKHQRRAGKTRLPEKCQLLVPYRFAIKMVDNIGYILRNDIIWWKKNSMPSSVGSRFTKDFEYFYFFVKDGDEYYFEQQFEPMTHEYKKKWGPIGGIKQLDNGNPTYSGNIVEANPLGRNKRSVWNIPTKPSSIPHMAMYPEMLLETPIKACCPEFICTKCGKAREKIFKSGEVVSKGGSDTGKMAKNKDAYAGAETKAKAMEHREKTFAGEYTDCGCGEKFRPGVVLDPFMGTGTTGLVARKLGRNFIGMELNPEFQKIANERINETLGLFA